MSEEEEVKHLDQGARVNGKNWKIGKDAFRVKSIGVKSTWAKKQEQRQKDEQIKAKLKELKQEKDEEKRQKIQAIKDKKAKKEEKERYQKLAEKMHAKKVERMRKREKRNKLLKDR
ncbi:rRNA-processing protein [Wickerhamomyces ciferrii]|uniref:rRNA-processing protein n=1 Tax=Wickerhamomyces ciferrii (strain ATCC 14091 / BCRC 22168 / CBS 111 / JCM 3599 / NBRC 0793 / NRRL Y-1031 F-60-10) TaxID=1206466 RepID=K0KLQ1_WICCF|nr:rRNA-processing protein [Wickerhamomyces ciferrii]CCH43147.1 rRNA-processing protein [Wickerhamomyces ciferrii]